MPPKIASTSCSMTLTKSTAKTLSLKSTKLSPKSASKRRRYCTMKSVPRNKKKRQYSRPRKRTIIKFSAWGRSALQTKNRFLRCLRPMRRRCALLENGLLAYLRFICARCKLMKISAVDRTDLMARCTKSVELRSKNNQCRHPLERKTSKWHKWRQY